MGVRIVEIDQIRIAALDDEGLLLASEQAALDILGEAYGEDFHLLAIPKARLAADFLVLRTGLLGAVTQKFVNYQVRAAFVGDFSAEAAASNALRDFIRETNAGGTILFAHNLEEAARLTRR